MLFEAIIRSLEVVSDVIEFGPVKAVQINTSFFPEAERDTIRILGNLNKENYTSTRPKAEPFVIREREKESVFDQEEEELINQAVSEKGYY